MVPQLGCSLSPLLGQPNSGSPEFGHYDRPKSDISDFGERVGVRGKPDRVGLRPSPQPSPRKNGERERTEYVALPITPHQSAL